MVVPRRVALFLDGTWNVINNNTNVWRLKSLCVQSAEQKVYYSVGVGTARGEKVTGGMFGVGINEEVIAAYEWLMENYESDDRIFIFGFSRGAFTARSLAGFIAKCGLLEPGSPLSMDQLYARYRKGTAKSILALSNEDATNLPVEDRWLKKYSRPIPVWFQGVWDTVGTLGVPLPYFPRVSRRSFKFLETDLRINQTHAYHALAIDEHRPSFKPTLWKKVTRKVGENYTPRDFNHVEQRWFVGAHSNVGGGYESDLLAQTPLAWIAAKAKQHGLVLKGDIDIEQGAAQCEIRDSLAEMVLQNTHAQLAPLPPDRSRSHRGRHYDHHHDQRIDRCVGFRAHTRGRELPTGQSRGMGEATQRRFDCDHRFGERPKPHAGSTLTEEYLQSH